MQETKEYQVYRRGPWRWREWLKVHPRKPADFQLPVSIYQGKPFGVQSFLIRHFWNGGAHFLRSVSDFAQWVWAIFGGKQTTMVVFVWPIHSGSEGQGPCVGYFISSGSRLHAHIGGKLCSLCFLKRLGAFFGGQLGQARQPDTHLPI